VEALATGPLMARTVADDRGRAGPGLQKSRLTCSFTLGAGDGNRTRTISLGSGQIAADKAAEQPTWKTSSSSD